MNEKDHELQNEPLSIRRRHGTTRTLRNSPQQPKPMEPITTEMLFMKAAAEGNDEILHQYLSKDPHLIHYKDANDWQALHEAIRGEHLAAVKYLIDQGADISWKVRGGGAALWLAKKLLAENHEIIQYLVSIGAPEN